MKDDNNDQLPPATVEESPAPVCSFCGRSSPDAGILICTGSVVICEHCVDDARDMIGYERRKFLANDSESAA